MKLKLAISSCPNDTFMFDALINGKIDVGDYQFELIIADIEELNKMVLDGLPDVAKLSYHSYFKVMDHYQLLNSGSALGENCGPLIICKQKIYPDELSDCKIAIPGINTTANLLLKLLFPEVNQTKEYLFSDIEDVVLSGECDAGLVIHETRFTYQNKGLKLIADLGKLWEDRYNLPIPLGGIAIKRSLSENIRKEIDMMLKKSIEFALKNPKSSMEFIKLHAFEMNNDVLMKHVALYVNNYSINLGEKGKLSVKKLKKEYLNQKLINEDLNQKLFVGE